MEHVADRHICLQQSSTWQKHEDNNRYKTM